MNENANILSQEEREGLSQLFPDNIDISLLVATMPDYSVITQLNMCVSQSPSSARHERFVINRHASKKFGILTAARKVE